MTDAVSESSPDQALAWTHPAQDGAMFSDIGRHQRLERLNADVPQAPAAADHHGMRPWIGTAFITAW